MSVALASVLAGCFAVACATLLQYAHPGDSLATMLATGGLVLMGGAYALKHREASRRKKDVEDLEKTATNLRAELFAATRTK